MADKSKRILIIISIVAAVAVLALVLIFGRGDKASRVEEQLAQAASYCQSMDYDHAVAIYNGILDSDSSCADAYIGLAQVYINKGNNEKAVEVLSKGYEFTADSRIFDGLALLGSVPTAEATETETTAPVTEETTVPETEEITLPEDVIDETETETTTEATTTTAATTTPAPVVTTAAPVVYTTQPPATTTRPPVTTTAAPATTTTVPTTTTPATTTTTEAPVTEAEITEYVPAELNIKLPNFIGMTKERAFEVADGKGIMIIFTYSYNSDYTKNIVFAQSFPSGYKVSSDMPVEVYVSLGEQE